MNVDFSHAGKQRAVTQVGLVVLVTCTQHTNTHCSVVLVHSLIVHWVCVWVSTSNSCLHRTHRCRRRAGAKGITDYFILSNQSAEKWSSDWVYSSADGSWKWGDDSGSEEVAAWQITAVCLQICPTEASPIKRDAATERFTVVDRVCSCWSLLHQHAEDFGPFLAFGRPVTVYSPHHAKMLNGGSIISELKGHF